jgi:hypothetical protein
MPLRQYTRCTQRECEKRYTAQENNYGVTPPVFREAKHALKLPANQQSPASIAIVTETTRRTSRVEHFSAMSRQDLGTQVFPKWEQSRIKLNTFIDLQILRFE